jgi:hypothetical protein
MPLNKRTAAQSMRHTNYKVTEHKADGAYSYYRAFKNQLLANVAAAQMAFLFRISANTSSNVTHRPATLTEAFSDFH